MRILVVEDEHKIAQAIKKGLEHERYAVDVVYNGKESLDFIRSGDYDLVILDRLLPEMDGVTICRIVRNEKIHVPILLLTAKGQVSDRVEGLDAGADDYLVKPFAFSELFARIRALIRRPKQSLSTTFTVGNLTLNTLTFEVKRGAHDISLSSKEFSLLSYLMRNSNKIVTKDQIMNNVWDYEADILPNSVEVYIKHLRNKVDSFPAMKPLIHTIRGFGYKLSA
jgi:DNA-binding response OmpR family regulator